MKSQLYLVSAALLLIVFINVSFVPVYAAGEEDHGMDVVIIIDTSGSMRKTDSERIAIEAAKLFIDMMETTGSRIGVVPFSDSLGTVINMTDIESQSDKGYIKQEIERLIYTGDTDIGLALQRGYDLLMNAPASNNQKVILFFTDGKIDLPNSSNRTDQDSMNDSLQVISLATGKGVPIYSIGLNSDGNVDQELITKLSDDTNGRKYIVENAEELPEIFDEIFADFINSNIISLGDFETDGTNYTEIPFNIPNSSVLEANLIMLSDVPLEDVQVYAPDGIDKMEDSNHVIWEESSKYSLVKLITPQMGDWTLRIMGQKGGKVHVNLIFNYRVNLHCEAQLMPDETGMSLDVTAWLEKEGRKLTDSDLYQAFSAITYLEGAAGTQTYDMSVGTDSFYVSIPIEKVKGEIYIYSRIESESMYRESEVITLNIANNAPVISNIPYRLEMSGLIAAFAKQDYIIEECITDLDGDDVSIEVQMDSDAEEVASVKVTDSKITIKPCNNGSGLVTITVTDSNGETTAHRIQVVVDFKMKGIMPIIFVLLLLMALLVVMIKILAYLKERNRPFYGEIRWTIDGRRGPADIHRLDYEKGNLVLGTVILASETAEFALNRVKIHMNRSMDGILIINNSKMCSMVMGYGAGEVKRAEIRAREFVILTGQYMGKKVSLRVEYNL